MPKLQYTPSEHHDVTAKSALGPKLLQMNFLMHPARLKMQKEIMLCPHNKIVNLPCAKCSGEIRPAYRPRISTVAPFSQSSRMLFRSTTGSKLRPIISNITSSISVYCTRSCGAVAALDTSVLGADRLAVLGILSSRRTGQS